MLLLHGFCLSPEKSHKYIFNIQNDFHNLFMEIKIRNIIIRAIN